MIYRIQWFSAQMVAQGNYCFSRKKVGFLTALMNQRHEVLYLMYKNRITIWSKSFLKPVMPGYKRATPCHLLEFL